MQMLRNLVIPTVCVFGLMPVCAGADEFRTSGSATLVNDSTDGEVLQLQYINGNGTNDTNSSFTVVFDTPFAFNTLTELSARYQIDGSTSFRQGSPRMTLVIDDGDNVYTEWPDSGFDPATHAHLTNPVNTTPSQSTWIDSPNLVTAGYQWESGQFSGGDNNGTFSDAFTAIGSDNVIAAVFAVDGYNTTNQNVLLSSISVNGQSYDAVPEPATAGLLLAAGLPLIARRRRRTA
jgi:hypothetical protein